MIRTASHAPKANGIAARALAAVAEPVIKEVELADIRADQRAQPRENLDTVKAGEYADALTQGDKFPPLVVFFDGADHWLADGFHRHYAAVTAKRSTFLCKVMAGGLRDAILYSVGANATHGVPRSSEDKQRAVLRLLNDDEWAQWSDREIARRCRVDHKTVARLRPKPSGEAPQIERKVERGGTVYTQKVAKDRRATVREDRTVEPGGAETKEITSETLAAQGVDNGARHQTRKVEITPPRIIFDELVALWCEATVEDRDAFVSYLRVSGVTTEPAGAAVAAGNDLREPAAAASGQIIREGDAPRATGRESGVAASPDTEHVSPAVPTAKAKAGAGSSTAPATPRKTLSAVEQTLLLRPNCKHAQDLELCGGSGRNHCRECKAHIPMGDAA